MRATWRNLVFATLGLLVVSMIAAPLMAAPIPPTVNLLSENFEPGSLRDWLKVSEDDLHILTGRGLNGSTGLAVAPDKTASYIYQSEFARVKEGYLTFWFNPNNVSLPEPAPSDWFPNNALNLVQIGSSDNTWWPPIVGLSIRKPAGQGYQGFLAWPNTDGYFYDYKDGQFNLSNGWQKITIGYKIDAWVAVWVNDDLMTYADDVVHNAFAGDFIGLGQMNQIVSDIPSGTVIFDDITFHVPQVNDLWVDVYNGSDANTGLTAANAFRTIQHASGLAGPGTTIHILPGAYRESLTPAMSGQALAPIRYVAENGPGTVILRGSKTAASLAWTRLTSNDIGLPPSVNPSDIYYADLSAWGLTEAPRFLFDITASRVRLPLAHEPDWHIASEWKSHEFWWAADGGLTPATCDPATNANPNCDAASRSLIRLTDVTDDSEPAGIEAGNLTTLGDLTGGTLVTLDTVQGHYVYRRKITAHNVAAGRVTVDPMCEYNPGSEIPGLGWGSKYYVENKPYLLDTPGEWWYDKATGRLYLWALDSGNPANRKIEISQRDEGVNLRNRSYIILDGLNFEFFNDGAISLVNQEIHRAYGNTVRNVTIRYTGWGIYVEHTVSATQPWINITDGLTIEDSEIAYIDNGAIHILDWWEDNAAADSFTHSGVINTVIRNNHLHHLGFRADGDGAIGVAIFFAHGLTLEGNYVHHVAHNGVQLLRSVVQSDRTYGFTPDEIKTGQILIKDNIFEKSCQLATDCGGLKIWGQPPNGHVFKDLLVTGNIFRSNFGWAYAAAKRQWWMGDAGSVVQGMGGFGMYVDRASGVVVYRNVAHNNAYAGYMFSGEWRDGDIIYLNNIAANNLHGFSLEGVDYDTHGNFNTQIKNNILINNEADGVLVSHAGQFGNLALDYNLYDSNGWSESSISGVLSVCGVTNCSFHQTIAAIRSQTPWEDHGAVGDAAFWNFDWGDHNLFSPFIPSFHLTAQSMAAIDKGMAALPASLTRLLTNFHLTDPHWGAAFDIGRYEAGFVIQLQSATNAMAPGGTLHYQLSLVPADLPYPVTLTVAAATPALQLELDAPTLNAQIPNTLTVTHDGNSATSNYWYTVWITGENQFAYTTSVRLLVGGSQSYLPILLKK